MSDSIFGSLALSRSPRAWAGQRSIDSTRVAGTPSARTGLEDRDVGVIAILEAPLEPGETAYAGFARKELELRQAFAKLTVLEARALQARISNPRPNDSLAQLFMRLTGDRRARLINFLADARRREALACHR